MNRPHGCREGDIVGVQWVDKYPYVITFCTKCRQRMRAIPLDDIPERMKPIAEDIIEFVRQRGHL